MVGNTMPLLFTPRQLTHRAEFYHQLGQLTSAGIGVIAILERLQQRPPAASYREPLQRVLQYLSSGSTLTESLENAGRWLPLFDTALLMAGEKSGRLDACFRLLSDYYTDRARVARQVITDLLYPVFLFHFFVIIYSFLLFIWNRNWLALLLGVLLPLYGIVFLLIYAGQNQHGERWRAFVEGILHPIPVLGTGRRYLALARLSAALEALISAGVTIIEAWQLAAAASGSPALRRTVMAWKPYLNAGKTPANVINDSPTFPELFANQYATGEVSGKLDETLRRLHRYYEEEGTRKLHLVARWVPIFLYLIVAAIIAIFIVRFYLGYFQQIQNIGGF